jgi:uncharacterized membrane protein
MQNKRLIFISKILVVIIATIVLGSYIYAFYAKNIDRQTYYNMQHTEAQTIDIDSQEAEYEVSFYADNLLSYKINATVADAEDGIVYFLLQDEDENTIIQNQLTFAEIQQNQGIVIYTEGNDVKKEYVYHLKLWCAEGVVQIQEYQGRLEGIETYNFMYGSQLKGFCIFLILLSVVVLCIMLFGKNFWVRFLLLAVCIHFFQNIASIPASAPDDFRHFLRAYDIASGNLRCDTINSDPDNKYGMTMPVVMMPEEYAELTDLSIDSSDAWWSETNIYVFLPKLFSLFSKEASDNYVECSMLATNTISPIAYIPQSIMIWLARTMGLAPIWVYYMARFGNFLFSLLMIAIGMHMVPQRRTLLMVLYMMPGMNLLRASCSTDGVLFACILLMLALFLKIWDEGRSRLNIKEWILVLLLSIAIASIKLPYILAGLIFVLLPIQDTLKETFTRDRMKHFLQMAIGMLLIWGVSYIIYRLSTNYFSQQTTSLTSGNSISYLFAHKKQVINLLLQYFLGSTFSNLQSGMCGQIAGAEIVSIAYMVLIVWTAGTECGNRKIYGLTRGMWICLVLGMIFSIYFVFYAVGDPTSGSIWGIQGRYFLPMAAIGAVVLPELKNKCNNVTDYAFAFSFAIGMLEVCCSLNYYI